MKKELYRKNKFNFTILLFTSLTETIGMIVISLLLERILAAATSGIIEDLYVQGVIFSIFLVIAVICCVLNIVVKPRYQKKAITQYKNNIYAKIIEKNIDSFNDYETSVYLSALTNDIKYIEENYIFSIFTLITQITLFILSVLVMFLYNHLLAIIAIVLSLIPLVVSLLVGGRLAKKEEKISVENSNFMHFVKDNLIGFSIIKVFQIENKIKDLFSKNNNKLETIKAEKIKVTAELEFLQMVTQLIAQFGVFFIGAYLCIKTKVISASVLILFVQLMNYVINPLATIPMIISKRNAALPLFKRIEELVINEEFDNKEELEFEKAITISNLRFSYEEKDIIKNINLNIEKDKSYAIVGTSGSGKTTLLNLLSGRNKNYTGEIKYDNLELKGVSLSSLYNQLSYVEQNVFVFDDTIANNVTLYSKIDEDLYNEIIEKSGLDKLLKEKGNDYKCGENGSNLSGGERQRISIARALLKKTNIILMDEATSALDNDTANSVMQNILDLKDITKIIITHNLDKNILRQYDEIIVISDGYIVEKGTFDNLLEKEGMFYSLYNFSNN